MKMRIKAMLIEFSRLRCSVHTRRWHHLWYIQVPVETWESDDHARVFFFSPLFLDWTDGLWMPVIQSQDTWLLISVKWACLVWRPSGSKKTLAQRIISLLGYRILIFMHLWFLSRSLFHSQVFVYVLTTHFKILWISCIPFHFLFFPQ